jgi:eukaryotic-like serine/threonine-protein kinase
VGAEEQPARLLRAGRRLGRYTVLKRIGCGGMAEVYLARADAIGGFSKAVALKVVHAHLVQEPVAVRSFLREARLAATLDHPNIVQVLDVGVMGGEHTLVMEHVHGRDVGETLGMLAAGEPMPMPCALRVVIDVCAALEYAHAKCGADDEPLAIVHRDVSPSNVLVGFNGVVKLTDFGIAKIGAHSTTTTAGMLKGKFGYMSPEQSLGQPVDGRTDVFSLGILLYETTTGTRAFYGANAFAIMNKSIEGDYTPPSEVRPGYPTALAEIVARCLVPEPELRYGSVVELRRDLEAWAGSGGVADGSTLGAFMRASFGDPPAPDLWAFTPTAETGHRTPTTRRIARRRWRAGVVAAGALALGLVIGASVSGRQPERTQDAIEVPPPRDVATVAPPPASAPEDEQVVILDDEAPRTSAESEPEAEPAKQKSTPRRPSRRPPVRPSPEPAPTKSGSLDGMFPSSMK